MSLMRLKIKADGIEETIKFMDTTDKRIHDGIVAGLTASSNYLRDAIKAKFGSYQNTGGNGGGSWKKLKYSTVVRKRKRGMGSNANKPLLGTGEMRDSIKSVVNKNKLIAGVMSDDPKLVHHVYGAPRAGVPRRDPVLITTKEEEENIVKVFEEELFKVVFKEEL